MCACARHRCHIAKADRVLSARALNVKSLFLLGLIEIKQYVLSQDEVRFYPDCKDNVKLLLDISTSLLIKIMKVLSGFDKVCKNQGI